MRENAPWARNSYLARLEPVQAERLLGLARQVRYAPGEVIVRQGDDGTHVCLLQPVDSSALACAKVTATLENGAEGLLGIRVGGDLVGEQAVITDGTRSATVTACSPVLVGHVTRERFMGFLAEHPSAGLALTVMMADRLNSANRRRLDFAAFDVAQRLSRILVELVEQYGHRVGGGHSIGVELSQPELGRLIGAGTDAVGRAMHRLKAAGLVRSQYRSVVVLDLEGLRHFADE
ncbi:Crp/Fnr family transcriptional regulator [Kitasatospora albolonga]|uniref:Crp/Fnr family transcriptional regulator n=1 Tax=Kitasatospora albolonga TaxID=68173 RepID=UPI0031F17BB0